MRVAHVLAAAAYGGLESVVAALTRAQSANGHAVLLVVVLDLGAELPFWTAALAEAGVEVSTVSVRPRRYALERRTVLSLLAAHRVEIVHTHGFRADVVCGRAAVGRGYAVVSTVHGFVKRGLRGQLYAWLQVRALRRFHRVVAVSQPLVSVLHRAGISARRVFSIPNGTFTSALVRDRADARERLGLDAASVVVGWVGRVSHEKGPDIIIDALRRMHAVDALLCVIGDGPELDAMRTEAVRHGVSQRVVFAGSVPDAGSLLRAFDLLVLSSRTEGTPIVVLEAARAGVPVAATAVGGVPALLGTQGGWLAETPDAAGLAAVIDEALSDSSEAERRAQLLDRNLRAREAEQGWVAKYDEIYSQCLRRE